MSTEPTAFSYSLLTQQIYKCKFDGILARGEFIEVRLKILDEGGVNSLYAHLDLDHTFFVLDGQGTFYF